MNREFIKRNKSFIARLGKNQTIKKITKRWFSLVSQLEYSYHFTWLGRPIIQFPQDIMAMQEIVWKTKPEIIIELGIAHGGSLIFYASLLEMINKGKVIGVDIDIRSHNRKAIERHSMYKRIKMIEGSSTEKRVVDEVFKLCGGKKKILLVLDSNHTKVHVLKELQLYSPLVKKGFYLVVFDTIVGYMPDSFSKSKPWSKNNSPRQAVNQFLSHNKRFQVDQEIENKLLITVAPGGYLKCIHD